MLFKKDIPVLKIFGGNGIELKSSVRIWVMK